jgi:hypothetical protein
MDIQDKFQEFHQNNPSVYQELCALARRWKEIGREKIGIGMLFEVLRWNTVMRTTTSDFKLNNNYRSRYVRLIQEQETDLKDLFNVRDLRAV